MTPAELDAKLEAACPFWTARDWAEFRSMPEETQEQVASALVLSATTPTDWAKTVLGVLLEVGEDVLALIPGGGAVLRVVQMVAARVP